MTTNLFPFLAGVSILFLVPIGIVAFTYSSLQGNETNPSEPSLTRQNGAEDSEIEFVPLPSYESETGGANPNDTEGIPIGKYSNPPTSIETGRGIPEASSRSSSFDSSVDRNRLRQETIIESSPDYSAPSSSNSYNQPDNNSLAAPLEDDSFLEVPEAESVPLFPFNESL